MTGKSRLDKLGIHASETAWVGGDIDVTISNDSTIDALYEAIRNQVSGPLDASERPLYVGLADSLSISS